ncbi:outer dynein arm-docking complex subunit 1 [Cylas formicarius]|uniref:outer dynein arm-docking complex subunit 1 n=1 Tax=Cylas formicarius TaxID=197179 RepID=UPI0029588407|nr:outer dynein arm-docking complex subunit 1 [Cylas formicarius]
MHSRNANASTEKEMVAMAEEELARLQRQFRIMEDDRARFSDETGKKLEKQRKIIKRLKEEKQKLCEDISVATCENQKRRDEKSTKQIYKLLIEYEDLCAEVDAEKEGIAEMDVQIKKLEADIKKLRPKSAVTENHFQTRLSSGKKAVQMLQDRLDNMVKKFCAILSENKELREEIDHLLKQRNHFNETWEQLLKEINSAKKYVVDLIEQAIIAFDQREEWCSKLEALKTRAEMNHVAHSEEMREIQRRLDHYLTLREFLCVKGQKRVMKDLEEKERKKKESEIQTLEDQLEMYETTLKEIQQFCNEEEVERIAALFTKQEEENFALFNYVNELTHELETLNITLDDVRQRIDDQVELSRVRAEQRQCTVVSLQNELETAKKLADAEENEVRMAENSLSKVLEGIQEIFNVAECDSGPILKLLGDEATINLHNVHIYLGKIEKKLSAVVTELYFAEKSMMSQAHIRKFKDPQVMLLS